MAKIDAGILSTPRGKVAGVVGASWKGIGYIRAKVTPANPNTTAQQAQRSKMSVVVAAAQSLLASVLIPFVSPFQKKMSGYNWFCKQNIGNVAANALGSGIVITSGTNVPPVITPAVTFASTTMAGTFTPVADTASGEADVVYVAIYDKSANAFIVKAATATVATKAFTVSISDWSKAVGDTVFAFSGVTKTGLATQSVSNSVSQALAS